MKKTFFILMSAFLLTACGQKTEDENQTPKTPPAQEENGTEDVNQPEDENEQNAEEEQEKASIEDQITVETPYINAEVASPLTVRGEARGTWFFEGSFPVRLVDENNKELARGNATSTESWMTEDFIPFEVKLDFDPEEVTSGTIILEKDNPSGLPENAGKLEIPVTF